MTNRSFLSRTLSAAMVSVLVSASLPTISRADDKAMALQLFKDGKALMNKGDFAAACPKFEAAVKLDPTADGTVLNLGLCYEGLGKWATAWGYLNESIVRAKKAVPPRPDREKLAKERIAVIEPKMSKVTIHVAPESRVDGLALKWDDKDLDAGVWDAAVPVDPGTHHLVATAPAHKTWETDVQIAPTADSKTVDVPKLEASTSEATPTATTTTTTSNAAIVATSETPTSAGEKKTPTTAWVLTGVGVALVGVTVLARIEASSAASDRKDACAAETTPTCDDTGKSKVRTWETVSFVSGGLALVSIGAAVYLFTSSPKTESPPQQSYLRVVPTIGGVSLQGAF